MRAIKILLDMVREIEGATDPAFAESVVARLECDVDSAIHAPSGWRGRVSAATRAAKKAHQTQELEKAGAKLARAREILFG